MKRATLPASISILFLLGCASTTSADAVPRPAAAPGEAAEESASAEDKAEKLRDLEQDLEIARARLSVARLEAASHAKQQEVQRRHAALEVQLAESSLAQLVEADMPNRLAAEKLDLRSAQDRAQEAAEELTQIEIMYKDQELDDVTAEFVVSRGRRSAERAAARIEVMENELSAMEERELPRERQRLQLAVDRAVADLAESEREAEIGAQNQAISVKEAVNSVDKLERELAEARAEADA